MGDTNATDFAVMLWLTRHDPGLFKERLGGAFQRGQAVWDKVFMGFIIVVWYGWLVLIALDARRLAPLARAGNSERRWRPADRGGTLRRLADVPGKFTRSAGDPHSRRASATRHQHRSLRDCAPPHVCGHKPLPDRHAFAARILARLARFAIDPRRIDAAHFHRGGCPAQWPCTAFAIGSFRAFGEVDKGASEADRCYSGSNIDSTVHQRVALPRAMDGGESASGAGEAERL